MENDETQINTRHKRLLEQIREEHVDGSERLNGRSIEEDGDTERGSGRPQKQDRRGSAETRGNPERVDRTQGVGRGSDSRNGSLDSEGLNTVESHDPNYGTLAGSVEISPSARELDELEGVTDKALREKELARQRQIRHRDREKKAKEQESSVNPVTFRDHPPVSSDVRSQKSNAVPPKPLSAEESKEDRDKLLYLYIHGSALLDDVLEIIVRDHEPVTIWALSPEEAELFVDIQLERAKKSPKEAQAVRRLVALYDRLIAVMIVAPRLKATGSYIKQHGGLSFR